MSERTNAEYAKGLRAIADWFEAHPDVPQPHTPLQVFSAQGKEDAIRIARYLGHADKKYSDGLFWLGRDFGGERLEFIFNQSDVCQRRVIGVEEVPERVIPAHTQEKVEWDCHPLLAPASERSEAPE